MQLLSRCPSKPHTNRWRRRNTRAQFLRDVVGDDDGAEDFDDISVEDYAQKKNIQLVNAGESSLMASGNGRTKDELLDEVDELTQENQDFEDQLDAIADIVSLPADEDDDDGDDDDDAGTYDLD
jgi:hypothetical protein